MSRSINALVLFNGQLTKVDTVTGVQLKKKVDSSSLKKN